MSSFEVQIRQTIPLRASVYITPYYALLMGEMSKCGSGDQ